MQTVTLATDWTNTALSRILTLGAFVYVVSSFVALIMAARNAYQTRTQGLEATRIANRGLKTRPHPVYVGVKMSDAEFEQIVHDKYASGNRHQLGHRKAVQHFGPLLWLHIVLPAFIGSLLGLILASIGFFQHWVVDLAGGWPHGAFTTGFEVLLCLFVVLGIPLAFFMPFKLWHKRSYDYVDYFLCIWAAFAVAFATCLLG